MVVFLNVMLILSESALVNYILQQQLIIYSLLRGPGNLVEIPNTQRK